MRIVLASSEAVPFSKTGGLADVATALPKALTHLGHEVSLITPYYPQVFAKRANALPAFQSTGRKMRVPVGSKLVECELLRAGLPGSSLTVYLIYQREYFDREHLYVQNGHDYRDNCERFVFFSRAVLQAAQTLNLRPDIVHGNDWQTGLIPALLAEEYRGQPGLEQTGSVFTIHNMAYQGQFWHWDMTLTGMDWKFFNWRQMEYFGNLNLLKTGIVFADMLSTVSPTYAQEIQTVEYGCGLSNVLSSRHEDLVGVLNGIDTDEWNPATDSAIARNYDSLTVTEGKATCKKALQQRMKLPVQPDIPVIGVIARMAGQKGFDLIAECAHQIASLPVQFVLLGSGEARFEEFFRGLAHQYPEKVATYIGYDEDLSHQVEAGADIFLMPSQFEPCGLNQMYSLRYGTVPIVRAVGGLADSVVDASDWNFINGTANGFSFHDYRSEVLFSQIQRALDRFADKPHWLQLQRTGMETDWSWDHSARGYEEIYRRAMAKHQHAELAVGHR